MMKGAQKPKLSFFLGALEKLQLGGELGNKLARLAELGFDAAEFSATDPAQFDAASLSTHLNRVSLKASASLTGGIYSRYRVCFASPESRLEKRPCGGLRQGSFSIPSV